ncbi:acyl carrier protein [Micromonospora sp. WP24]|uniref:acyl carrier protein n=1 Tax=unclassified Micromonospora TaxID=2617518 RepID=UPI00104E9AD0|nr:MULTISPECIES: acyl carrier protein [unclassified Micromonospora]TDC40454.1 acyl carrier protein [Micromonospora sp. 15K316]TYC00293.1 acyl carrier protein [Micromonospora sp. WP24]
MNEAFGTVPTPQDPPALALRISAIWRDVLRLGGDAPPDATFLELQGQSISAVRIAGRIEEELGIEVDAAVLFEDPDLPTFINLVMTRARSGH